MPIHQLPLLTIAKRLTFILIQMSFYGTYPACSMPQINIFLSSLFSLVSSFFFFISTPYLAASRADLSFIRGWVDFLGRQPSRRSQLPKTLSVSVSFVFASDHQHPSSSLRVDVNVRGPSVDERMKMRDRKIPSNDSALSLRCRNCMNGEDSKVTAEPMIIRALEWASFRASIPLSASRVE